MVSAVIRVLTCVSVCHGVHWCRGGGGGSGGGGGGGGGGEGGVGGHH
jgi:hypothetical protein